MPSLKGKLALQKQANDGRCSGPPPGGYLRYSLRGQGICSAWKGKALDQILCRDNSIDDGDIFE